MHRAEPFITLEKALCAAFTGHPCSGIKPLFYRAVGGIPSNFSEKKKNKLLFLSISLRRKTSLSKKLQTLYCMCLLCSTLKTPYLSRYKKTCCGHAESSHTETVLYRHILMHRMGRHFPVMQPKQEKTPNRSLSCAHYRLFCCLHLMQSGSAQQLTEGGQMESLSRVWGLGCTHGQGDTEETARVSTAGAFLPAGSSPLPVRGSTGPARRGDRAGCRQPPGRPERTCRHRGGEGQRGTKAERRGRTLSFGRGRGREGAPPDPTVPGEDHLPAGRGAGPTHPHPGSGPLLCFPCREEPGAALSPPRARMFCPHGCARSRQGVRYLSS